MRPCCSGIKIGANRQTDGHGNSHVYPTKLPIGGDRSNRRSRHIAERLSGRSVRRAARVHCRDLPVAQHETPPLKTIRWTARPLAGRRVCLGVDPHSAMAKRSGHVRDVGAVASLKGYEFPHIRPLSSIVSDALDAS